MEFVDRPVVRRTVLDLLLKSQRKEKKRKKERKERKKEEEKRRRRKKEEVKGRWMRLRGWGFGGWRGCGGVPPAKVFNEGEV